jgi:beta-porphyranase
MNTKWWVIVMMGTMAMDCKKEESVSPVVEMEKQPFFVEGNDPKPAGKNWKGIDLLSDDFEGSTLNEKKWQKEPVGNDWNWIGRPPGLFKTDNVVVKDGKLNVTVGKLDNPVEVNGNKFLYQGGIVRAINPGQVGYYYECRMKANKTEMSSTFWLMSKYDCEKKLELDIQECVGRTTEETASWAKKWNKIFHSNTIHRQTDCLPKPVQIQGQTTPETENWVRFYVYGAWWKSPDEIQFFLDGKYVYSIKPNVAWDRPAFLHMAIETYDWNPVPADGGMVARGTWEERTTQYDWVRAWKLD